jgi:hypothetical protein
MTVIKVENVTPLGRGGGVVTIPLITRQSAEEENLITTGISTERHHVREGRHLP